MVEDELLEARVTSGVATGQRCVEWALADAVASLAGELGASKDPYRAERSHDFEFVGARILG